MTNQEFKSLTNIEVSPELFKLIHAICMACGDSMTKADFCADYKKHKDSTIITALFYNLSVAKGKCNDRDNRIKEIQYASEETFENNLNVAENLLLIAKDNPACADRIEEEVKVLVGEQMALTLKLEAGYPLSKRELEMCLEAVNAYDFKK